VISYVIQKTDTSISKLAKSRGIDPKRWPEFCAANPKLKKDANAGCLFYVGQTVNLPDSWAGTTPLTAPPNTPIPQPHGAPVTPGDPSAALAPAPSLFSGLDQKKVMIGAAAVAALIVGVYAFKRKGAARAA
jgi:hypothetical protein